MARPLSTAAREKMIAAAQEVVTVDGVEACTIEEVARRSGVAKTTIYRHFADADELVIAAVSEMIQATVPPDTGSLQGDLRAVVLAFRSIVAHPTFRQLFATMLSRAITDPDYAELYRRAQELRHVPLRLALQRGLARGEVDPSIDLEQAMYFVQGPFVGKRMVDNVEVTDHDIDVFVDLITKALAPG